MTDEFDLQGESGDKDQRVLSAEDKPVQETFGQLPNSAECYAQVDSIKMAAEYALLKKKLSSFRFKFYFRFLQSVNREVAREVNNFHSSPILCKRNGRDKSAF